MKKLLFPFLCLCGFVWTASDALAAAPKSKGPVEPGIYGIGFTNVTDNSARLVFTSSEPMRSQVVVTANGKPICVVNGCGDPKLYAKQPPEVQPKVVEAKSGITVQEIHQAMLENLPTGVPCTVNITGATLSGKIVTAETQTLVAKAQPPSTHQWPGYTIFATTIGMGDKDPALHKATMDYVSQLGVSMVRYEICWITLFPKNTAEPDPKGLAIVQARLADLKAQNIEPLVVLDYSVPWTRPYTNQTTTWRNISFGPPDRLADWEHYVRAVAKLVKGQARYFEIWNEPDAGYLATGVYVERPGIPTPITRPPFMQNPRYWLGDRYAPMVTSASKILHEVIPDALVMNGGWNHDYSGSGGDILLNNGVSNYLDCYAYHAYCGGPNSFAHWFAAVNGKDDPKATFGIRRSIEKIFARNNVQPMPWVVTEWGTDFQQNPNLDKGFVSIPDGQKWILKGVFYFLSLERMEILTQFKMGVGGKSNESDESFMNLVNVDKDGKPIALPTYYTYQWLATTFNKKTYAVLPVQTTPKAQPGTLIHAYAIHLKENGETYLTIWQDPVYQDKKAIEPKPALPVQVTLDRVPTGRYTVQALDLQGKPQGTPVKVSASADGLPIETTLPEITDKEESSVVLLKITSDYATSQL